MGRGLAVLALVALLLVPAPAALAAPANDDFADATVLRGWQVSVRGTTVGATVESGTTPPDCEPQQPTGYGHSVWYRWKAPATGTLRMKLVRDADIHLSVFTARGGCLPFGSDAIQSSGQDPPRLTFNVQRGQRLWFSAYNAKGPFRLKFRLVRPPRPANDNFGNAQRIGGRTGAIGHSNAGATRQRGEPWHGGRGGHSLWYRWTAPVSGRAVFNTLFFPYDTQLAVYTGRRLGSLKRLAANDDANRKGASSVTFQATAGTTYSIALDTAPGFELAIEENHHLWWDSGPAPRNDRFGNARVLPPGGAIIPTTSRGARIQRDEPSHGARQPGASVWYRWTAPVTGWTNFGAHDLGVYGMHSNTRVRVYTGTSLDSLKRVSDRQDDWFDSHYVNFDAVRGRTYYAVVAGDAQRSGTFYVQIAPPAINDRFGDAQTISGALGTTPGSTWRATAQSGEPAIDGRAAEETVWFNWTPQVSGTAEVDTRGSDLQTSLAVFTGSSLTGLTKVASNTYYGNDYSRVTFPVSAGTTYRIVVDSPDYDQIAFRLNWRIGGTREIDPPTVAITAPGGGAVRRGDLTLRASASDTSGIAAVRFNFDDIHWDDDFSAPYERTVKTWMYKDGYTPINVRAWDRGSSTATDALAITLDNRRPFVWPSASGGALATRNVYASYSADEYIVKAECSLDGGPFRACGESILYRDLADGDHVFRVRATDEAGTRSFIHASTWRIDTRPIIP